MPSIEEIKHLSPRERIERLKKLEEERKKEIEEAETLMSESVRELGEQQEKKNLPIEQMRATDFGAIPMREEREMMATKQFKKIPERAGAGTTEAGTLEEITEEESGTETAEKGRKATVATYGSNIEKAKDEQNPMRAAYKGRSVTSAEEEKEHAAYEQSSVTGVKYEGEQKTKGTYKK